MNESAEAGWKFCVVNDAVVKYFSALLTKKERHLQGQQTQKTNGIECQKSNKRIVFSAKNKFFFVEVFILLVSVCFTHINKNVVCLFCSSTRQ